MSKYLLKISMIILLVFLILPAKSDEIFKYTAKRPVVELPYLFVPGYFNWDFPNKNVMPNMDKSISWVIGFSTVKKEKNFGFDFRYYYGEEYSRYTLKHVLSVDGSNPTTYYLRYSSKFDRLMFGIKWVKFESNALIKPFLNPQIGLMFFRTKIYIPDPEDRGAECLPLEDRVVHMHNTLVYGGQVGLEINFSRYRLEPDYKGTGTFLIFSFGMLRGVAPVKYINAKYVSEFDNSQDHHHSQDYVSAQFINIKSKKVHSHHIAEIYKTPLRFTSFSIGLAHRY